MQDLRYAKAATFVALIAGSGSAIASDFSPLLYFFYALWAVIGVALGALSYVITKGDKGVAFRACVWGIYIAVVFTPVSTHGGNGTSKSVALLDILVSLLGGDSAYALGALWALLFSIPGCIGIVALMLWIWRQQPAPGP